MAETTPQDRLTRLFANSPMPSPPPPGQVHFSEKELEDRKAQKERPRSVPATAEYPKKSPRKKQGEPQRDILTDSEEEDEYVALFQQKPSMKPTKNVQSKPRKMPEPNAFGYPKDAIIEPKGPIEYLAEGKWSSKRKTVDKATEHQDPDDDGLQKTDDHGNTVISRFCQFNLASKFPYKYMHDPNDRVSRHFFASNKFYAREWDLYYLHAPFSLGSKPIVLVPYEQVEQLIEEIGQTFKLSVSVPKFPFTITFFDDGTPQPVFLGKSSSRDEASDLQNNIPAAPLDHGDCPANASNQVRQQFDDFKSKCQAAIMAKGRNKGGVGKKKRDDDRLTNVKDWYVQLRRAQRYMGLRHKTGHIQHPDPQMPWEDQERLRQEQLKKAHFVLEPLDLDAPAPFPFEKEPVIVSVDVESYERAHNLITEIGVSTLDTRDLVAIAPGLKGKNWLNQIRSRHFRIIGREQLVNKDFCIGHPNAFQFGKSEWVELKDAAAAVDSCFEWPFSAQYKHASLEDEWNVKPTNAGKDNSLEGRVSDDLGGVNFGPTNAEQDAASRAAIASVLNGIGNKEAIKQAVDLTKANQPTMQNLQSGSKERNIILLGHDVRTDVDYLKDLGSKIFSSSRATYPIPAMDMMANGEGEAKILVSITDSMDTGPLYRVLKEETQNRSLSSIMSDLGLICYFPHNGGNDARYTLEAWVAMLVEARLKADKEQEKEDQNAESQLQAAKENDAWNQGSDWGARPLEDPGLPTTPEKRKEDLDAFEAAMMASSPEASPPGEKDAAIVAMAERLKLDPSVDFEEPKGRFG